MLVDIALFKYRVLLTKIQISKAVSDYCIKIIYKPYSEARKRIKFQDDSMSDIEDLEADNRSPLRRGFCINPERMKSILMKPERKVLSLKHLWTDNKQTLEENMK